MSGRPERSVRSKEKKNCNNEEVDALLGDESDVDEVLSGSEEEYKPDPDEYEEVFNNEHDKILNKVHKIPKPPTTVKRKYHKNKKTMSSSNPKPEVIYRQIRSTPSALKEQTDKIKPRQTEDKRKQIKNKSELFRDQLMNDVSSRISKGDHEGACNILVKMMSMSHEFWGNTTRQGVHSEHNHQTEDIALLCIDLLEKEVSSRELFLEMIRRVGKISANWMVWGGAHIADYVAADPLRYSGRTMTRCAQILLEEGDLDGLEEIFGDFKTNLRNTGAETVLQLFRSVSAILERKRLDESSDAVSLGNLSLGTTYTTKSAPLPPETILNNVVEAMKCDINVDNLMPLISWYLMDEKCADDAKAFLTDYRDQNMDHLPAHTHLLDFLFKEYGDETDLLVSELKEFADRFHWDSKVLTYCQLTIKQMEDEDLDESFDSTHSKNKPDEDSKKLNSYLDILDISVQFLDYEFNRDDESCWSLLANSMKYVTNNHDNDLDRLHFIFDDRGGWWMKQNFEDLEQCNNHVLSCKLVFVACLYGDSNEYYIALIEVLNKRNESFPSSSLENLLKEIYVVCREIKSLEFPAYEKPPVSTAEQREIQLQWRKIKRAREKHLKQTKKENIMLSDQWKSVGEDIM